MPVSPHVLHSYMYMYCLISFALFVHLSTTGRREEMMMTSNALDKKYFKYFSIKSPESLSLGDIVSFTIRVNAAAFDAQVTNCGFYSRNSSTSVERLSQRRNEWRLRKSSELTEDLLLKLINAPYLRCTVKYKQAKFTIQRKLTLRLPGGSSILKLTMDSDSRPLTEGKVAKVRLNVTKIYSSTKISCRVIFTNKSTSGEMTPDPVKGTKTNVDKFNRYDREFTISIYLTRYHSHSTLKCTVATGDTEIQAILPIGRIIYPPKFILDIMGMYAIERGQYCFLENDVATITLTSSGGYPMNPRHSCKLNSEHIKITSQSFSNSTAKISTWTVKMKRTMNRNEAASLLCFISQGHGSKPIPIRKRIIVYYKSDSIHVNHFLVRRESRIVEYYVHAAIGQPQPSVYCEVSSNRSEKENISIQPSKVRNQGRWKVFHFLKDFNDVDVYSVTEATIQCFLSQLPVFRKIVCTNLLTVTFNSKGQGGLSSDSNFPSLEIPLVAQICIGAGIVTIIAIVACIIIIFTIKGKRRNRYVHVNQTIKQSTSNEYDTWDFETTGNKVGPTATCKQLSSIYL